MSETATTAPADTDDLVAVLAQFEGQPGAQRLRVLATRLRWPMERLVTVALQHPEHLTLDTMQGCGCQKVFVGGTYYSHIRKTHG